MLNNFALMILSDNRKKNYIIKNKDKLTEEEILKIINSSKKGIAIFSSFELYDLNISNNAFFTLLSNIPSDVDKENLYLNTEFGFQKKFSLKDCSDDIIVNFINSIENEQIKSVFVSEIIGKTKVFLEVLKKINNKIDYIINYSYSLYQLVDYLSLYQETFDKLSDIEIFDILSKFQEQKGKINIDNKFIEFVNQNIISDEIKMQIIDKFNLLNELSCDNLISLLNNSKDYHNIQSIFQNLKNKYSNNCFSILYDLNSNELKEYIYKDLLFDELVSFLSDETEYKLRLLGNTFKNNIDRDNFLYFMIPNFNNVDNSIIDLISSEELKKNCLFEKYKKNKRLLDNREVCLYLIDEFYRYSTKSFAYDFLESEFNKYLTKEDLQYIQYLTKINSRYINIGFDEISKYFNENGITQDFYLKLFNEYEWHQIDLLTNKEDRSKFETSDLNRFIIEKFCEINGRIGKDIFIEFFKENNRNINFNQVNKIGNFIIDICSLNVDDATKSNIINMTLEDDDIFQNIEYFENILLKNNDKIIYSAIYMIKNKYLKIRDIKKYFNENGITEFGFQKLFNEYNWDLINRMLTKEEINNYSLSDLDRHLLLKYFEINDVISQKHFINYIRNNKNKIEAKQIDDIVNLIIRISDSNSTEIQHMRDSIIPMLLETNNPFDNLKYIEDVFIHNNLPTPAKLYLVFDKLHPNCSGFNFDGNISPVLKSKSVRGREAVIFSDLLKASLGSNNRTIKEYLDNIYKGNILFKAVNMNLRDITELTPKEMEILSIFVSYLNILYNNTLDSNVNGKRNLTGDLIRDINELNQLFTKNGEIQKDLPDRIVRMFGYLAGFNTYQEMLDYMNERHKNADERNRREAYNFTLAKGDFIKGIGAVKYLGTILQNGSVAKEYLGDSARSDLTPLDTDLSQVQINGTLTEMISSTAAKGYGPIWFVLKNDGKFNVTRTEDGDISENIRDLSKLEVFYTGALGRGHYGIRTGFASSDIDYILCDNYDKRISLEIVMNGFYIPIIDKNTGELLFSPNDYDILRGKMMGLSHYDTVNYSFSNNLENPLVNEMLTNIEENEQEVNRKRNVIINNIRASLAELGLTVKTEIDGDITPGSVELIDTGSTGRKTNMPGDGDFDFIMRLDQNIIISDEKLNQLKNKIREGLSVGNGGVIGSGDFRLKDVNINGLDVPVDIDITFITKTNKLSYSTDMCLKDRLETIRKQSPEKYPYVIANIQLAKKVLKEFECYKPNRGDKPQGGLGGVGVENWILQNGGSFYDACVDFLKKSKDKSFEEFKKEYQIWDFGENHLAEKKGYYTHDNFVTGNMSEDGYNKMKKALLTFVNNYTFTDEQNLSK